jgi:glutathione S-transferase
MLKLYGVARSRASRNLWLMGELGLDYTLVPVMQAYRLPDAAAADAPLNTRSASFMALSVAAAVPVLEDEGFVLSESLAINLYLAKKAGGPLAPADAREEALMTQWALYLATAVEPDAVECLYIYGGKRQESPEGQAELATHAAALERPLKAIETHLARHGHMVGGRFTVADINTAEILRYAQAHPPLLAPCPATRAWLEACQSRPAFRAMMAMRSAEPA